MTRREKGSYALLDNPVLAYVKRHHNASAAVLVSLAERDNYTHLPAEMKVPELMLDTDLGQRAVEKCLGQLEAVGLAARGEHGWTYSGANCRANRQANDPANRLTNEPTNHRANERTNDGANGCANGCANEPTNERANNRSQIQAENAVQDDIYTPLKELEGILEDLSLPLPPHSRGSEGRPRPTHEGGPGTSQHPDLPSRETPGTATLEAEPAQPTPPPPPVPATPPAPALGDPDAAARQLFGRIAGPGFVLRYRDDIPRWHGEYSKAFVHLAYRLGPAVKAARVPSAGFVFLLNRTQPWPPELQRQYAADLNATRDGGEGGEGGAVPTEGEIRVLTDGSGRSGRVIGVDEDTRTLTLQTGIDATEAIDVPWASTTPSVRRSA